MKFEVTFKNGAKLVVEVPDAELFSLLEGRVKSADIVQLQASQGVRGPVTAAVLKP